MPLSSHSFVPDGDLDIVARLLPECAAVERVPERKEIHLYMKLGARIGQTGAGRLLILNGKCRTRGVTLRVFCGPDTMERAREWQLDRLMRIGEPDARG